MYFYFFESAFAEEDLVPLLLAGVVNHELFFAGLRPLAVTMAQIHWHLFEQHLEQSWIHQVLCQYTINHFRREASANVRRFEKHRPDVVGVVETLLDESVQSLDIPSHNLVSQ